MQPGAFAARAGFATHHHGDGGGHELRRCQGRHELVSGATEGERELVDALERTFQIIHRALDTWTIESLGEVIRHPEWDGEREHTRGYTLSRSFAHDMWHIPELIEAPGSAGLDQIDLWS